MNNNNISDYQSSLEQLLLQYKKTSSSLRSCIARNKAGNSDRDCTLEDADFKLAFEAVLSYRPMDAKELQLKIFFALDEISSNVDAHDLLTVFRETLKDDLDSYQESQSARK